MSFLTIIPAGAAIGIDTAPFIYYIESNSRFDALVVELFDECIGSGRNPAVTSVITLAEVLVGAFRAGQQAIAQAYRERLTQNSQIKVLSLTPEIAERAASIRAAHNVKLPDALQFAAAISGGVTHFVTNDDGCLRLDGVDGVAVHILNRM